MVATASPPTNRYARNPAPSGPRNAPARPPAEAAPILFQKYFKSIGPRTYAAQVKRACNGNHFLVITEGKRHPKTNELHKTRLLVFGEDFVEFFRMLHDLAVFVRDHPVPDSVKRERAEYWSKQVQRNGPETTADR